MQQWKATNLRGDGKNVKGHFKSEISEIEYITETAARAAYLLTTPWESLRANLVAKAHLIQHLVLVVVVLIFKLKFWRNFQRSFRFYDSQTWNFSKKLTKPCWNSSRCRRFSRIPSTKILSSLSSATKLSVTKSYYGYLDMFCKQSIRKRTILIKCTNYCILFPKSLGQAPIFTVEDQKWTKAPL